MNEKELPKINNCDELKNTVKEKQNMFLYCTAVWCGKCAEIAPIIYEYSQKDTVKAYYKVDIGDAEDIGEALEIEVVPTMFVFKDGKPVDKISGTNQKAVTDFLDKHL